MGRVAGVKCAVGGEESLGADGASGRSRRLVQCHGGAISAPSTPFRRSCRPVDIDGAPGVAFEAGVEQARRVLQRGALGEGQLHDVLVGLAGADDPVVLPDRNPCIAFDGFRHFTSSTTSGSACLMRLRTRASVSPRQSLSSLILASISPEGESPAFPSFEPLLLFLMVVVAFFMVIVARRVTSVMLVSTLCHRISLGVLDRVGRATLPVIIGDALADIRRCISLGASWPLKP